MRILKYISVAFLSIIFIVSIFFLFSTVQFVNKFERIRTAMDAQVNIEVTDSIYIVKQFNGKDRAIIFNKGTEVELNYWATWCRPCIEKMRRLEKVPQNTYFITFESDEVLKDFFEKEQFSFEVYQSSEQELPFTPQNIKYYPFKIVVSGNAVINN